MPWDAVGLFRAGRYRTRGAGEEEKCAVNFNVVDVTLKPFASNLSASPNAILDESGWDAEAERTRLAPPRRIHVYCACRPYPANTGKPRGTAAPRSFGQRAFGCVARFA